jgi:hypothetical protein
MYVSVLLTVLHEIDLRLRPDVDAISCHQVRPSFRYGRILPMDTPVRHPYQSRS